MESFSGETDCTLETISQNTRLNRACDEGRFRRLLILAFLKNYQQTYGFMPNYREIAAGVGLRSLERVHDHLNRLQKDGLIQHEPALSRAIRVLG